MEVIIIQEGGMDIIAGGVIGMEVLDG